MKQETNKAAGPEAGGTSGQSVHKSKFRQKSKQEQAAASKLRMEQRGEKLEKAKDKLAKQKPPKKPGPVKRVGRTAGRGVHGFVHGKLFEVEQENVGTEGAHRSELVGESALRHGSRFIKKKVREHPAKAVHKAESKYIKATADYHFRMAAQEHPEMSGNSVSRMWRKHRLKSSIKKGAGGCKDRGGKRGQKDSRRHRKSRGKNRRLCEASSRGGAAGPGLPAPALCDAVLFFLPGDAGELRRGGRGRDHLPLKGRGYSGGGGQLFRHGGGAATLPGHLRKHPQL